MKMITNKNDFSEKLIKNDELELRETKILPSDF